MNTYGGQFEKATDGNLIYPQLSQQQFGYDGNGRLSTITIQAYGNTYVKTLAYNVGGKVETVSLWVKQ